MKASSASFARNVSYLLFAALFVTVVVLKLGPLMIAGLFSFMVLDSMYRSLRLKVPARRAKWIALGAFLILATLFGWFTSIFIRGMFTTVPKIASTAIPRLVEVADAYGYDLPFDDMLELRELIVRSVKQNVPRITKASGRISKRLFYVIAGIFIAIFCFFTTHGKDEQENLYDAIRDELFKRAGSFMAGFEKVVGAQVIISAINTAATAVFLVSTGLPHIAFLVPATFVLGLLPIVGNIISNAIIVASALMISTKLAVISLGFLVFIHKAEYFLNSRIVGASIRFPTWLTLMGIVVGEVVMGVPGIILAPAIIYYVRAELSDLPYNP